MPRVTELWTGHIEGTFPKNGRMVRRDAVWGGAVVETEPISTTGVRWRYVAFFCGRGQAPRIQPKPMSSEREANTLWRTTVAAKKAEGYVECDWSDRSYGLEMTVRELGTLPGGEPAPIPLREHAFIYGDSRGSVAYCRICGQEQIIPTHGFNAITAQENERLLRKFARAPAPTLPPVLTPAPIPLPPPPIVVEPEPVIEIPDLARRRERRDISF
jgi:hypothetical protein